MDSQKLVDLLEDAGLETRSYSGRGMYGKECVAFTVSEGELIGSIASVVEVCAVNYELETVSEFVKTLKRASTDQMGRDGVVVYFPRYEWPS